MGSVLAMDLSRSPSVDSVTLVDVDPTKLEAARRRIRARLVTEAMDLTDAGKLARFLPQFDVIASALPHGTVHPANVAAARAGSRMVDIAFEDSQMGLDGAFKKSGGLLIPGCGLAPGLAGILLYEASRRLGGADEGHLLVGGLPQKPRPPFGYRLVFSIVGLLREYTDDARVVRGGEIVRVSPFANVVSVRFPRPVGTCEAFYTDGLASLLYTLRDVPVLDELTVRWPGHAEKMKLLVDAGFLSHEPHPLGGQTFTPFDVTASLLAERLALEDPEDLTVMRVIARKGSKQVVSELIDLYDREQGVTSMGRTTAYTGSIVAQMVGSGAIRATGTVPPEVALGPAGVEALLTELRTRGVNVKTRRRPARGPIVRPSPGAG
jgi:lysine 6-dehydrogenase